MFQGADADWPALALLESGHDLLAFTAGSDGGVDMFGLLRPPGGDWSAPFFLHGGNGSFSEWPYLDAGSGSNATWIVSSDMGSGDEEDLVLGRFDATTGSGQSQLIGKGAIEFASVDHDAAGNVYAVWSDWKQRLVLRGVPG